MTLRRVAGTRILAITVDPHSSLPAYRQVYTGVRQSILDGAVSPGTRLPSTRSLAADLGVSRNTVVMAYERLRAEGYAVGRGGSDTRVVEHIPDRVLRSASLIPRRRRAAGITRPSRAALALGRIWARMSPRLDQPPRAFRAGVPATDLFPYALWGRLLSKRWGRISARDLGYANPQGFLPLREAISRYVAAARGVVCSPDQVFIVGGSQTGLAVAARLILDHGDQAWAEDPGYHGARGALVAAGAHVIPVPIDGNGIRVDEGIRLARNARAAFVTPTRQMPTGVMLSSERRTALLAWAKAQRSWIVEDDYDSELRFASRPLPALQSEDVNGSVIYIGTFSKLLFPALRLGYLVLPPGLVEPAMAVRHMHDVQSPILEQMVLADFIEAGHFERHVRRVRQVYSERQESLRAAVQRHLQGILELPPGEAGLFVTGRLNGIDDQVAAAAAAEGGVDVLPLSRLANSRVPPALVLGYAGLNVTDIAEGVKRLADALVPLATRGKR